MISTTPPPPLIDCATIALDKSASVEIAPILLTVTAPALELSVLLLPNLAPIAIPLAALAFTKEGLEYAVNGVLDDM